MDAIITYRCMLTKTVAELTIQLPRDYPEAKPGQFIRIKCNGVLLPRPISICWQDYKVLQMGLIVEARGAGTEWLIFQNIGAKLEISVPLGNGFTILPDKRYLLVGGGIGIAPLAFALEKTDWNVDSIICFTSVGKIVMENHFRSGENAVVVATDDGSFGVKGRADEILSDYLLSMDYASVYKAILACGPKPMLMAIAKLADEFNIPCQVSLEEYMACGVGACKGCAVQLVTGMGTVCKDGPVFDAKEVIWND